MSIFAISDLHLSFADTVNKPMDVFGPDWVNHAERLKNEWIQTVSPSDFVVIPGDISWGLSLDEAKADLQFIDGLPGMKILLRGNHDFWWSSMKKMRGLYKTVNFIQNDAFACEDCVICGTRLWSLPWVQQADYTQSESDVIFEREILRLEMSFAEAEKIRGEKKLIVATHFPPLDKSHKGTRITEIYQNHGVDIAVYGHLHGKHWSDAAEGEIGGIEYRLVSLDRLNAKPLKLL